MKKIKSVLAVGVIGLAIGAAFWLTRINPPVSHKTLSVQGIGEIAIAQPLWGANGALILFADAGVPLAKLSGQFAAMGMTAAVIEASAFFKLFNANNCLDTVKLAKSVETIKTSAPGLNNGRLFIAGTGEGALLPFLHALSTPAEDNINLSIGFSAKIPDALQICQPLKAEIKGQGRYLTSAPVMRVRWRSVWNEKPAEETAAFVKEYAPAADTDIAAYNTPLDIVLLNEIRALNGQGKNTPPMPIVEIPAQKHSDTVTLFYSGDGGWRDLDRSVAEEMVKLNYPVLGVDVLRYFWERKTPEQVTADLAATMRYYRAQWGVKSFVLAGFSFGADILPVIYNKLSEQEKATVDLLVFLALGNHADFEVHVAGWLGQETREIPLVPELAKIPAEKVLCLYGKVEKDKTGTACSSLESTAATVIELPGGHHFDKDYPKLAKVILESYRRRGIQ